ncbi:MAG: ATP-binding cassette domain-containing protein [Anaerococcus sp.]|nr:ATP-binding cassette domain-containing protein [Anaerococcus sp.]
MLEVDIYKNFGDFTLDLDFIADRTVLAILGGSGSGKSLTLKTIAGIINPDRGRIVLDGKILYDSKKKINLRPQDRHIGFLFQDYALFPNMTVYENIKTGLRDRGKEGLVEKIIGEMNLSKVKNSYPREISGGEKQRCALARILINEPRILLLDEPFSAIDTYLRWHIEVFVKDIISKYDIPTLFVSHDRDEVYRMSQDLVIIKNGKIAEKNPTKEVFKKPKSLAGAELIGCKNFSKLKKIGPNIYKALAWDLDLTLNKVDENDLIGIRGEDIEISDREISRNSYNLKLISEVEEISTYSLIIKKRDLKTPSNLKVTIEKTKWKDLRSRSDLYFTINEEKLLYLENKV